MGYYVGDYYQAGGALSAIGAMFKSPAVKKGIADLIGGFTSSSKGLVKSQTGLDLGAIGQAFAGGPTMMKGPLIKHAGMAGVARRYRRMNPGNVRALRRSMRRVQSFARLARQTIQFTQRVKMKKRRRR